MGKKTKKQLPVEPDKKSRINTAARASMTEAVAAAVEIVEVRLFQSAVHFGKPKDNTELTVGHFARTKIHEEGAKFLVFVDFLLHDGPLEDEPPMENEERLDIRATFMLSYELRGGMQFSNDHFIAFGEMNGIYNAWPFWREYVYSTFARMGLRPITLPVFRLTDHPRKQSGKKAPAMKED